MSINMFDDHASLVGPAELPAIYHWIYSLT
jgi:hypothetical protein